MLFKAGIPPWMQKLILQALKGAVTPEDVAAAYAQAKAMIVAQLRALAQSTANKVDDFLVDKVEQALTQCSDELKFLCDLVEKGEAALVAFLRDVAAKTPNVIDDWGVEVLAEALGVPKAAA